MWPARNTLLPDHYGLRTRLIPAAKKFAFKVHRFSLFCFFLGLRFLPLAVYRASSLRAHKKRAAASGQEEQEQGRPWLATHVFFEGARVGRVAAAAAHTCCGVVRERVWAPRKRRGNGWDSTRRDATSSSQSHCLHIMQNARRFPVDVMTESSAPQAS